MSDNLRRYRAICAALTQGYPGQPTGTVARHLTTLAALISGIVGSKSTHLPQIAMKVPDGTQAETTSNNVRSCDTVRAGAFFPQAELQVPQKEMRQHGSSIWWCQPLERVWRVYQAPTKRHFAQRLRRLAEWTPTHLSGAVAAMVVKMCHHRVDFTPAYDWPQAHRTSNAVDRLLNSQARVL